MKLFMHVCLALIVVFLASIMTFGAVNAQGVSSAVVLVTGTAVSIPWGNWIAETLTGGVSVLALAIMGIVIKFLPSSLSAWLTSQRIAQVEQLLERALGFAAQNIGVAVKGKVITLDVKNELIQKALQYAIDNGPKKLIEWMGGTPGVTAKLIARIPTSPSVAAVVMTPAGAKP